VRESLDSGGATGRIFIYNPLNESEFFLEKVTLGKLIKFSKGEFYSAIYIYFNLITGDAEYDLVDTIDMNHGEVIYRKPAKG